MREEVVVQPPKALVKKRTRKRSALSKAGALQGQMLDLSLYISVPQSVGAIRLPTVDMSRTSTACLKDQFSISTPTVNPPGFASNDILIALYGQPGRSCMLFQSGLVNSTYVCSFSNFNNNTNWCLLNGAQIAPTQAIDSDWPLVGCSTVTSGAPHGPNMSIGSSKSLKYVFLNASDYIVVTSIASTVGNFTGYVELIMYQWNGKDCTPTLVSNNQLGITAGVGTMNIPPAGNGGWCALRAVQIVYVGGSLNATPQVTVSVNCVSTSGWMCIHPGDVDQGDNGDPNLIEDCRVDACALLVTNSTSVLNKQGTVNAARMRNIDFMSVGPSVLAKAGELYNGSAAKGVYTFKEFTHYAENYVNATLEISIGSNFVANTPTGIQFDLDYDDYYHFIRIVGDSHTPNTFTCGLVNALEFRTEIARYPKGVAVQNFMELVNARQAIASKPQWFYENPLHMMEIYEFMKNAARKAMKGVARVSPFVASIGSVFNPQAAPGLSMLNEAFQQLALL